MVRKRRSRMYERKLSGGIRREDQEERRRNGCGEIGRPPKSIYIVSYIAEDILNLGSNR